ncbi:Predicted Fe-S-cluster oxidoreductase [Variovorax sp. HW608]|uniref:YkgJ family cysteine cluster protein n=1 Tax=Variovorax sp. HW608 TaxID=1034889 RepID=UPI00081FE51A|nr:YkgJ family cysteine cluster protein [Variovorax sp. HW608]SCK49445.1 Predicted Fe-S-cluster oxidoreductase [Variovorax sp. HW608]
MTRQSFMPHTEAFAKIFTNASERERTMLGEMHLHYEGQVRKMVEQGHEPHNIAHTLNGLVDDSVAETLKTRNGRQVQCKRGCAACCKIHVSITLAEASLLLIAAEQKRIELDWDKVERQAEHGLATWKELPPGDRRCVFLNEKDECRAYEHRPAACRKYLVASDPKNCNTYKYPDAEVRIVAPIVGEAVVSSMLGVLDWGSMPRMLKEIHHGR